MPLRIPPVSLLLHRVRPNNGAELCLETCNCRRLVEEGTIIVGERCEALKIAKIETVTGTVKRRCKGIGREPIVNKHFEL